MKNLGKDTKVNNKNFRKKSLKPLNYNYYNPLNTMQNYDQTSRCKSVLFISQLSPKRI